MSHRTPLPWLRRYRHLLVSLVAALVLCGSAAYSIGQDYVATVQQRTALVRNMARVAQAHVRSTVQGADIALRQIIDMVVAAGDLRVVKDAEHWERLRDFVANVDGGQGLWVFDPDGNAVLSSLAYPTPTFSIAARAYFAEAKAADGVVVGPAFYGGWTHDLIYVVARAIRDKHGVLLGVAVASMNTSYMTDFYQLMSFDTSPVIGVYRTDGSVVARSPDMEKLVGANIADGPLLGQQVRKAPEGTFSATSVVDGVRRLSGYRSLPEYKLVAYAGIDWSRALDSWRRRAIETVIERGISLAIILLAMSWGFRSDRHRRLVQHELAVAVEAHQQLSHELECAQRDHLTGLPMRPLFLEMVDEARRRRDTADGRMALMLVDLDGFKAVNDSLGHDKGDAVLAQAADVLRSALRETDLAGRLGGDEFGVCTVAPADTVEQRAAKIAQRIVERMAGLGGGIGCSVGIAVCSPDCSDLACSLRKADEAMYEAKRLGKGRFVVWGRPAAEDTQWEGRCCFEGERSVLAE